MSSKELFGSSDEDDEYERALKKVGKKNPIERSQQYKESVSRAMKRKGDASSDEDSDEKDAKKKPAAKTRKRASNAKSLVVCSDESDDDKKKNDAKSKAKKPTKKKVKFDDSEDSDEKSSKKKRSAPAKRSAKSKEPELYMDLSEEKQDRPIPHLSLKLGQGNFLKINTYRGKNYLTFRKFDEDKALGGITMPLDSLDVIKKAIDLADKHVKHSSKENN